MNCIFVNMSMVRNELFCPITQRLVVIPYQRSRIKDVYGTDTVACFAAYPVLKSAPHLTSHTATALTVKLDDFNYTGDGYPTKYVLQYVVSEGISTCSQYVSCVNDKQSLMYSVWFTCV